MSYVNISPEELLHVSVICLEQHQNYNGEDDKEHGCYKGMLWWKKKSTYKMSPRWTYLHCGIITRLDGLKSIAENVIRDERVEYRDVKLSLTTHGELYKLLNKSKDFQPYIFGMGY